MIALIASDDLEVERRVYEIAVHVAYADREAAARDGVSAVVRNRGIMEIMQE